MGNLLTLKGRYAEGLQVDKRLVQLRPTDPLAHYNLACSYALLKRADLSIKTLRRAVELGYRDFRYMREDHDLDAVRHDPRFRQPDGEYEKPVTPVRFADAGASVTVREPVGTETAPAHEMARRGSRISSAPR